VAAAARKVECLSTEENKAIIRQFYTEVWNNGRVELVDELIAPSFVNHGSDAERGDDRESFKQTISKVRDELKFRHTVEELIAEGDAVVARLTGRGETAAEGRRRGEPLTGMGAVIWKLQNGQITERWAWWQAADPE
jgi:predicted SnoaL-like aldol condensation-catalyzing enzyme